MKHKRYVPLPFESALFDYDRGTTMYRSMVDSDAFSSLTKSQRLLYMYMKSQRFFVDEKKHPENNKLYFFFNKYLYMVKYKLYSNSNSFAKDRDALIEHGFIICIYDGNKDRKKSIYAYSDEWKKYGTNDFNVPTKYFTLTMLRKRREQKLYPC